jgi:hypothetical protein
VGVTRLHTPLGTFFFSSKFAQAFSTTEKEEGADGSTFSISPVYYYSEVYVNTIKFRIPPNSAVKYTYMYNNTTHIYCLCSFISIFHTPT